MRISILVLILAACAVKKTPEQLALHPEEAPPVHGEASAAATSIEAKELAASQQSAAVTELEFRPGKTQLSPTQHSKLAKAARNANEVKIVSWADQEYPKTGKLSDKQIQLAKQRGDELEKIVRARLPDAKIEKFNMAERPGKFAEWYGSADANIKKNLERAGFTAPRASRAFVLLDTK